MVKGVGVFEGEGGYLVVHFAHFLSLEFVLKALVYL